MGGRRMSVLFPTLALPREVDRLMSAVLNSDGSACGPGACAEPSQRFAAPLDVAESADAFVVEAELPGVRIEDVELSVLDDSVTLRARRAARADESVTPLRRERSYGEFERTLRFATAIDSGAVTASMRDGVLTVRLPKSPAARPRRVEVRGEGS